MLRRLSRNISSIALLFLAELAHAAPLETASLRPGDMFPQLTGQTLSGKQRVLPADAAGKLAIVVLSFSRAGGKDSGLWSDRLAKDFPATAPPYTIMVIEAAPKFVRGMIVSGSRKNMSSAAQGRCIALEKDEDLWKQRVGFSDSDRVYLFLLAPDGHIRWQNSGRFTESEYASLKRELTKLLQ